MKRLLILGAGTGGTLLANRMLRLLPEGWEVAVVEPEGDHLYQPGLLFLPFEQRRPEPLTRPRAPTLASGVKWIREEVDAVDTVRRTVHVTSGAKLHYDLLVIATGARIRPDLTPGLLDEGWYRDIFDFYTVDGAFALQQKLAHMREGRVIVNVVEMPIKCPVAPLEFLFLADAFFRTAGVREKVELVYATPLDAAFTRPVAAKALGHLLEEKGIRVETEFATGEVDPVERVITSYDERKVGYDLLVTIPTHSGAPFVERSGFGNELAFVTVHPRTLAVKGTENVFALGDCTDAPASKAGSVAHFQGEALSENLLAVIAGRELREGFDGHANCFVETGDGKAMLIDFNYDVEPLPGRYPIPGVGPFSLLAETRVNHFGKRAFEWIYWNGLLPAHPLPVPAHMSMAGKAANP